MVAGDKAADWPNRQRKAGSKSRVAEMLFVSPTPLFVFADPEFGSGSHLTLRIVAWRTSR
jgi:hypothetical protein